MTYGFNTPSITLNFGEWTYGDNNKYLYNDYLDSVAIWDRVLTADEIAQVHSGQLYTQAAGIPEPSTLLLQLFALVLIIYVMKKSV